jgi:hypothetical protein
MLWVEALARKSDVFGAFPRFKAAAENALACGEYGGGIS